MLTMDDIREYTQNENFKYLVIEASHGDYYGFNLKVKKERAIAMKIVSPDEHDDFMIVGWKVSKTLPPLSIHYSCFESFRVFCNAKA